MKVFPDTNVLASAFGTRGVCAELLDEVLGHHELVIGNAVLVELRRALLSRFCMPVHLVDERIEFLAPYQWEGPHVELPEIKLRDPDDLAILAAAVAGGADVLVTGDRDLLSAAARAPIRIVSPRGFFEML